MTTHKKLGLALGCGGWRGLAHLGVIKALLEAGIKIDCLAGTSAGALVGGLYAALGDIDQVIEIFHANMNYRRLLYAFSDPRPKWGLFKGDKMIKIFDRYLAGRQIEDCQIPFCALATDLLTSHSVELNHGNLSQAIRASIAVPFFLQPVKWDNMRLIDGGTSIPVPVETVRKMGAEVVIAVNLQKNQFPMPDHPISPFQAALKTSQVMVYHLAQTAQQSADLVLWPDIKENGNYTNPFTRFVTRGDVFDDGQQVVQQNLAKIKKMLS